MMAGARLAALLMLVALGGCAAMTATATMTLEEQVRLETDADCRNATPGNRLPYFRCTGDYDSFD